MYLFQLSGLAKSENIRYICELIYGVLHIPIRLLNRDGDVSFEFGAEWVQSAASDKNELFAQLKHANTDDYPLFKITRYMEIFFTIQVTRDEEHAGTLIVGPAITSQMDGADIDALLGANHLPLWKKPELANYYQTLPVIDYNKLVMLSTLLYYLVCGKKLNSSLVIEKNAPPQKIENVVDSQLTRNRQHAVYHHTPAYEKYLLQYVREGDKEKLLDHLSKPAGGESGRLSKNPLRNQKNLFICGTTLIARAAIEGGLNSELALTISDSYIQQAEEMNEIRDIMNLHYQMLIDFTDRVHKVREHHCSKTVAMCQNYIFKHLYEKITLSRLADITGMSRNYLSELFKKEAGIPLSEYIQKSKIEEAKKLLLLTDTSIMDICVSLNFSDQSYFTKTFRKYARLTPKQYRDNRP